MSSGKAPSRVIDGPYASWGTDDDLCQIALASLATIKIGQPVCIDVTQLGPDNNVPNNAAQLPLCERVVATTSANAGPLFGIVTSVSQIPAKGLPLSYVNGVPTYTNTSGVTLILPLTVRQQGWGYIWAGTARTGGTTPVTIGSSLITSTTLPFAIAGTAAINVTCGTALDTAINTTESQLAGGINNPLGVAGAAAGPGVVSIVPNSLVGLTLNTIVLIDSLASGIQEAVSVGSISYPTFSVALTQAHPGGFKITGPATLPANAGLLISVPGSGVQITGLVASYINVNA